MSAEANEDEAADPVDGIKKQKAGENQNAGENASKDEGDDSSTKTQDLTSRAGLDPSDAEE